jgi:hypothetical protein
MLEMNGCYEPYHRYILLILNSQTWQVSTTYLIHGCLCLELVIAVE